MTNDDLTTALRDRVRDEHPDVDHLIRVSTRAGTRLRRRRTVGVSIAGVAAAAVTVGIIGASLGGSGSTPSTDPGVASQPTVAASSAATKPTKAPMHQPVAQTLPVHVDPSLQGWEIGLAGDDKFPASTGDSFLSVVVRPMSEYASWTSGDPDHPDNQVAHVGGNYFVTVQPNDGVPMSVMHELLDALRYDRTWKQ